MRKLAISELDRLSPEAFKKAPKFPLVVVLDNIRSMHNVGAVFRTADAFRIEKVCLCGITPKPPHREIRKTAIGASETVEWEYFPHTLEAVAKLKKAGYELLAVEHTDVSRPLHKLEIQKDRSYALIFGNEVKGMDDTVLKQADICVEIPQFGTKHSLNIAVSAGIVLWACIQRRL